MRAGRRGTHGHNERVEAPDRETRSRGCRSAARPRPVEIGEAPAERRDEPEDHAGGFASASASTATAPRAATSSGLASSDVRRSAQVVRGPRDRRDGPRDAHEVVPCRRPDRSARPASRTKARACAVVSGAATNVAAPASASAPPGRIVMHAPNGVVHDRRRPAPRARHHRLDEHLGRSSAGAPRRPPGPRPPRPPRRRGSRARDGPRRAWPCAAAPAPAPSPRPGTRSSRRGRGRLRGRSRPCAPSAAARRRARAAARPAPRRAAPKPRATAAARFARFGCGGHPGTARARAPAGSTQRARSRRPRPGVPAGTAAASHSS